MEVIEALGVRYSRKLLRELNNTFIALILKKEKSETFNVYRPIALCNILYKLFTKTMAMRIQKLFPNLISEEQTGFVQGRSIFDGVIIAQEAIHTVQNKKEPSM